MNVWQRKDGRYGGEATVVDPVTGRRRRVSATASTRREVRERLAEARRRVEGGAPARDSSATVGDVARRWAGTSLPVSDRSASTRALYADTVARFILGEHPDTASARAARKGRPVVRLRVGETRLRDLTAGDVERAVAELDAAGLSASTRRRVLTVLALVLDVAVRDGLVARNVARDVDRPREQPREARAYTPQELAVLLEQLDGERLRPLVVVLAHTGLRIGEALALRWVDVELDAARLRVRGSLVRVTGQGVTVSPGKTARSRRVVPLTGPAVEALREWRAVQAVDRLALGAAYRDDGWTFTTELGTPLDVRNVGSWYRRQAQAAGVGGSPHTLRHTAASTMLAAGVSVRTVAELLGHAKTSTTWDTYGHVSEASTGGAVDVLAEAYGSAAPCNPVTLPVAAVRGRGL